MDQETLMKEVVAQVLQAMGNTGASAPAACEEELHVTKEQYPLGEKIPEKLESPTGVKLSDMNYADVIDGKLNFEDLRVRPQTLELQAQVAESVRRDAFAGNMRRAAELIAVPDERLLEIYNALRPYRSTKQELLDIADELEGKYDAKVSAKLVRDAAAVYEKRNRLKK